MRRGRTCSRASRPSSLSLLRSYCLQIAVGGRAGRDDWILCQITSKPYGDTRAIKLENGDFATGSLRLTSFIRPGKLFTAHATLVTGQIGELNASTFAALREAVKQVIGPQ